MWTIKSVGHVTSDVEFQQGAEYQTAVRYGILHRCWIQHHFLSHLYQLWRDLRIYPRTCWQWNMELIKHPYVRNTPWLGLDHLNCGNIRKLFLKWATLVFWGQEVMLNSKLLLNTKLPSDLEFHKGFEFHNGVEFQASPRPGCWANCLSVPSLLIHFSKLWVSSCQLVISEICSIQVIHLKTCATFISIQSALVQIIHSLKNSKQSSNHYIL